ncbi:MAG: methylated-DNA--[protein]-cysteine S-methyltransferase [Planctomycetota bacterium]
MLIHEAKISRIRFGFKSEWQLLQAFDETIDTRGPRRTEKSWITRLKKYCSGQKTDLRCLPVDLSDYTKFQSGVLQCCREIPYGQTISYGDLAARVESPRAARAVGTAMKKNKYPLVVPCHRVVSVNGLGGYSAADGVSVKIKLLKLEGAIS